MLDYRAEREKEMEKFREIERKESGAGRSDQQLSTNVVLPEWFTKGMDPQLVARLGKKLVNKPMEAGSMRAKIRIVDPPYEGTSPRRQRKASKKAPIGES